MYKLSINKKYFPFKENVELQGALFSRSNLIQHYALFDEKLHCYYLEKGNWESLNIDEVNFKDVVEHKFADLFDDGRDVLITSGPEGTRIYNGNMSQIGADNSIKIKDRNGYDFLHFGQFREARKMLVIKQDNKLAFYEVSKTQFSHDKPLIPVDINTQSLDLKNSKFYISSVLKHGKDNLIVQSTDGIDIYKVNKANQLQHLYNINCCNDLTRRLHFATVTGRMQQDILYFNTSGLYLHQFDKELKSYRHLNSFPLFSVEKGWTERHANTVRFQDINFDGKQEMIFTGPQGMSILNYNIFTNQWRSILDNSHVNIALRSCSVVDVTVGTPTPTLFILSKDKLYPANLEYLNDRRRIKVEYKKNQTLLPIDKPLNLPPIADFKEEKECLLLRDHLDYSFIRETVDRSTGKLRFLLPLIDIPYLAMKVKFIYDGKTTSLLGFGWSLPENLILLDHQSSIFPEYHKYYVMSSSSVGELKASTAVSPIETSFKFLNAPDDADIDIRYNSDLEQWTVSTPKMKQVFGKISKLKESEALVWERHWPAWRGFSNSSNSVKSPVAWYLSQVTDEFGNSIYFNYESSLRELTFDNNVYNQVHLSRMFDDRGNQISFKYEDRDPLEISFEKKDIFHFHADKRVFLKGYTLETLIFRQEVMFKYTLKDNKRLLKAIRQIGDNQAALRFKYDYGQHFLTDILLPNNVKAKFNYDFITFPEAGFGVKALVYKGYKVLYGPDYILISSINNDGKLEVQIYNREMTVALYSSFPLPLVPQLQSFGTGTISFYETHVRSNYLLLNLWYEDKTEIILHHWENGLLSTTPFSFQFSRTCIIKRGDDFVVASDNGKAVVVIEWKKNDKAWKSTELKKTGNIWRTTVSADKLMFVVYDDENINLWRRDNSGNWQPKLMYNLPGFLSEPYNWLYRFNLEKGAIDKMWLLTRNALLQFNKNIILLTKWSIDSNHVIHSHFQMLVLSKDYNIFSSTGFSNTVLNVKEYTRDVDMVTGDKVQIMYSPEYSHKYKTYYYRLHVYNYSGPTRDDIENSWINKPLINIREIFPGIKDYLPPDRKTVFHLKAMRDFSNALNHELLLPYEKFYGILAGPTVTTYSTRWRFNSNSWVEEEKPMSNQEEKENESNKTISLPLGDHFLLEKHDENSSVILYRLINNEKKDETNFISLGNINMSDLAMKFPVYLAYPRNGQNVEVLEFSDEGMNLKRFELPMKGNLSYASSYEGIIVEYERNLLDEMGLEFISNIYKNPLTYAFGMLTNYERSFGKIKPNQVVIQLYHMLGIRRHLPSSIIYRSAIQFGEEMEREVGFNFSTTSAYVRQNTIYFKYSIMKPGNDQESFGWIEEGLSGNGSMRKLYNNLGKLVRVDESLLPQPTKEPDTIHRESTLFDKTREFPVAKFFPYNVENGIVNFYGFEDYESYINSDNCKTNPPCSVWQFKQQNVQRNKFSFTGQNFLRLQSKEELTGTFYVDNNNMTFVASTWVRPRSNMPPVGNVVPYLKVTVGENVDNEVDVGFLSEIKLKSGDWYYLESVVNLYYADQMLNRGETSGDIPRKLKIKVIISAESGTTLDVDHVRFSPLNCLYQANVYDVTTKTIRDIIQYNGLVRRYLYDKLGERIGTINELGQLTEFNTYTKAANTKKVHNSDIMIKTQSGFYEDFNPDTLHLNWIIDEPSAFQVAPEHLKHVGGELHSIKLKESTGLDGNSFGIRLYYKLYGANASVQLNRVVQIKADSDKGASLYVHGRKFEIPLVGELLVLRETSRLFVWVDGVLNFDEGAVVFDSGIESLLIKIDFNNTIQVSDLMFFNNPNVAVTYFNDLGEKTQMIELEDEHRVIVTEYLYDKLGRQSITTRPIRVKLGEKEKLVAHFSKLITNRNPSSAKSVWSTGNLEGEIIGDRRIGKHDYTEFVYHNDPCDTVSIIGLPGTEFSKRGPFKKQFQHNIIQSIPLSKLYPTEKKYTHNSELRGNGSRGYEVLVDDVNKNRVAWYVHASEIYNSLCTYEYDNKNRLVKILSRLYHEKVGTLHNDVNNKLIFHDKQLQQLLGTHFSYDDDGNVLTKTTPDSGKIENGYDESGLLKLIAYYQYKNDELDKAVYFIHDGIGRVTRTGLLKESQEFINFLVNNHISSNIFQLFQYSEWHVEPRLRGRLERVTTHNHNESVVEERLLNSQKEVVMKRIIIPANSGNPLLIEVNKRYAGGKVIEIEYPVLVENQHFTISHEYDKLGRLIGLGIPGNSSLFFSFSYSSTGQLVDEIHYPGSTHPYTRHYTYNTAGFTTGLEDKYLTEKIFYTEPDYAGYGYGDGTVTRTEFTAKWHPYTADDSIELSERTFIGGEVNAADSKMCFEMLKKYGYIDEFNHQNKIFYRNLEPFFPLICTGRNITMTLGKKGFPAQYGHMYSYGLHGELIRGKYFVGTERPKRLQRETFSREITSIKSSVAHQIWVNLVINGYVRINNDIFEHIYNGGKGIPYIRKLKEIYFMGHSKYNSDPIIERILSYYYSKRKWPTMIEFQDQYSVLLNSNGSQRVRDEASIIYNQLNITDYFGNPLDKAFKTSLQLIEPEIPDVVNVLTNYFAKELGEAEFDVGPYTSDVNGNLQEFWIGFDHYHLLYHDNSNRISTVSIKLGTSPLAEQSYVMEHDHRGNVIKALHKGIKKIHYHQVLNRPSRVVLDSGKCVNYYYDAKGERVMKKVVDDKWRTVQEVHYIRDEFGRTLVERQLTHLSSNQPVDLLVTVYIYGPRGLIGFVRRDEFHSVITDHENSIRLVVKSDQVIAAYDYLPYGGLMREYVSYPDAHVRYRYTGQEWDEEIGLYNYHARFYDPTIGRFYQVDPKDRNFSPYVYASNSPISIIDPTGEEPITALFCFLGFLAGSYFGGAAANGAYNPFAWDWSSTSTWMGILAGGFVGATIPGGFMASVSALATISSMPVALTYLIPAALGIVTSYISIAATLDEYNPLKWDWTSPHLWNAAIRGFAIGSGAIGSISNAVAYYKTLSVASKVVFVGSTMLVAGGSIIVAGHSNNWDFSKPALLFDILQGILGAADFPMAVKGSIRFLSKNQQIITSSLRNIKGIVSLSSKPFSLTILSKLKPTLIPLSKSVGKIVGVTAIVATSIYFHGKLLNDWDLTSPGTYMGIIDGFLAGYSLGTVSKDFYKDYFSQVDLDVISMTQDILENGDSIAGNILESLADSDDSSASDSFELTSLTNNVHILDSTNAKNIENGVALSQSSTAVIATDRFIYNTFPNENGNVVLALSTKDIFSSPFYGTIKHNGSSISDTDNDRVGNKELMDRLRETYEVTRQNNKANMSSLLAEIDVLLNGVEKFNKEIINRIEKDIQQNIEANGYVVGGEEFISGKIFEFRNEISATINKDLERDIVKDKNELSEKQIKIQTVEEYDNLLAEIHDLNKVIGVKMGVADAEIEKLKYQTEIVSKQVWKTVQHLEEAFVGLAPINSCNSGILTEFVITPDSFASYNDKQVDIHFMRSLKSREYLERFELCNQCMLTSAPVRELNRISIPKEDPVEGELTVNKIMEGDSRVHFLAPFNEVINPMLENKRAKRSVNVDSVDEAQLNVLKIRNVDKDENVRPAVISKQSFLKSLSNWLKGFMVLSNSKNKPNREYGTNSPLEATNSIDVQSTLLLAKVLVAKKFNRKLYTPKPNINVGYQDALAHALFIAEAFEDEIVREALTAELPEGMLSIDFNQVYNDLIETIIGNRAHEIFELLNYYTISAYPDDKSDNGLIENRNVFIANMDQFVQKLVHNTLSNLFDNNDGLIEFGAECSEQDADKYSTSRLLTPDASLPSPGVSNIN